MAQLREPTRATFDGSRDWLSGLVETFDSTERLHDVPCEASAVRAMRERLDHSATIRPTTTRPVSHRYARAAGLYSPASCSRGS